MLEICCYSVESVETAARAGADRVELCANPLDGGTTPSYAAIELAVGVPGTGVNVIIRPRGGDFCYSDTEFSLMKRDLEVVKSLGADGVVIGILNPDGSVDKKRCMELVRIAEGLDITFHRAFDMSNDPFRALDTIHSLGIGRILTSGTRNTVNQGLEILHALVLHAAGRLSIMAGGGVRLENMESLYQAGIREFHSSASAIRPSGMEYYNPFINMGKAGSGTDEYAISTADYDTILAMRRKLDVLSGTGH